ncbi:MAG: hypothetical protein IJ433_08840 [Ruminococcus sp.]|nr:hypothetical protein [Ruminococcus sp.]
MKKLFAIAVVAVMMLVIGTVSAFAEVSPTAKPEPGKPSGPSTSPQTGDIAVVCGAAATLMTAATAVLAVKKIKE